MHQNLYYLRTMQDWNKPSSKKNSSGRTRTIENTLSSPIKALVLPLELCRQVARKDMPRLLSAKNGTTTCHWARVTEGIQVRPGIFEKFADEPINEQNSFVNERGVVPPLPPSGPYPQSRPSCFCGLIQQDAKAHENERGGWLYEGKHSNHH